MLAKYESLMNQMTQNIVSNSSAEKVVLFGSFAEERNTENSDIDLFIIKPSNLRRDERDSEIRPFLKEFIYPMDIFVYTPEEVDSLKNLRGSFVNKVLSTGKVLYERK